MGIFKKLDNSIKFSIALREVIMPKISIIVHELKNSLNKIELENVNDKALIQDLIVKLEELYNDLDDLSFDLKEENKKIGIEKLNNIILIKINILIGKDDKFNKLHKKSLITNDVTQIINFIRENLLELKKKLK